MAVTAWASGQPISSGPNPPVPVPMFQRPTFFITPFFGA